MPCKVKTALDVSMPKRLYWVTDGSGLGCSQLQFWHAMPWGRPPQHGSPGGSLARALSDRREAPFLTIGDLPCRSRPIKTVVTIFPGSGTESPTGRNMTPP